MDTRDRRNRRWRAVLPAIAAQARGRATHTPAQSPVRDAPALDPRLRLWSDLIFCHCAAADLLQLRGVCRGFRAQLNTSALWLPWTRELPQLRHDERADGWRGVERGMRREAITRANCAAGRYSVSPVRVEVDAYPVLHVAGRVVAFRRACVELHDIETGALVASLPVAEYLSPSGSYVVMDRWVPLCCCNGSQLLVDCVSARLVHDTRLDVVNSPQFYCASVSGSCFAYTMRHRRELNRAEHRDAVVMRIECQPGDVTLLHEVARVPLDDDAKYYLCERGQSLLYFERVENLKLIDLATRATKWSLRCRCTASAHTVPSYSVLFFCVFVI